MRTIGREIFTANIFRLLSCFALASALVPALAQTPGPPSAPAGATTKVFISNLTSQGLAPGAVGPRTTYNQLYAAMQNLAPYQVVMDPAQADLIFEIRYKVDWRCERDPQGPGNTSRYREFSRRGLTIWDAKTHVARGSHRASLFSSNSVASLLKDAGITGATVPKNPAPAPRPPQISDARTVFLSDVVDDQTQRVENPGATYDQVKAALEKWGRYKLVTRTADADLIMELAFTGKNGKQCLWGGFPGSEPLPTDIAIELKIFSSATNTALWEFSQRINWNPTFFHQARARQKELETGPGKLVDQLRRFVLMDQLRRFVDGSAVPKQPK